mmetsp:Transcript_17820/g.30216  ORF Transcript_17820/g.30216 Transcript_17820/m.30216 type:complete len:91 (-) Transcript_17820:1331-1603(-)
MRHSKRDYLTTQDVDLAMKRLNIATVFGYPSHLPFKFLQQEFTPLTSEETPETQKLEMEQVGGGAKDTLWYEKPRQVDLHEYVLNHTKTQ